MTRFTPPLIALTFGASIAASVAGQPQSNGVDIAVTTLTPVALSANTQGGLPAVSTLPPNTPISSSLNLLARSMFQDRSADALRIIDVQELGQGFGIRLQSTLITRCLSFTQGTANAFVTPHDILVAITPRSQLIAELEIEHSLFESPAGMHATSVDIGNDGAVEAASTTAQPRTGRFSTIPIRTSAPLLIRIQSSSSTNRLIANRQISNLSQSTITVTLRPVTQASGQASAGCLPDVHLHAFGRLDGGVDMFLFDRPSGGSPIGTNVLVFGALLPNPIPLPLRATGTLGPCTLTVTPTLTFPTSASSVWQRFELTDGPPLSARPITLHAQSLGLIGTAATPESHSSGTVRLDFR